MLLVSTTEEHEAEWDPSEYEDVIELASLLPGTDVSRRCFGVVVFGPLVQPFSVGIHAVALEVIVILEFVERVMLQIVGLDHLVLAGRRLISESVLCDDVWRFVGNEVLLLLIGTFPVAPSRQCWLSRRKSLHTTLH